MLFRSISAEVINMATVKPLDEEAILTSAAKTKAIVVAEEHNMAGGLGEAVAGLLARTVPTPVEFVNGKDLFGQSGTPSALMAQRSSVRHSSKTNGLDWTCRLMRRQKKIV